MSNVTYTFTYRGYTISSSPLNKLFWIAKGRFGVSWADSEAQAKAKIDAILEKQAYQDAITGANPKAMQKLIEGLKRSQ